MRRECMYCGTFLGAAPGACEECGDKAMRLIDEDIGAYNKWVTECLERKNAKKDKA